MKTVIVGCGRVGAVIADSFDQAGHEVIVVDTSTGAFDRLPSSFKGTAIRGDGTDETVLRRAGAIDADIFLAMTEGDNRNVLMAQLAAEELGAQRVIAKINDPVRAAAYADLGVATICRTTLMADAIAGFLGMPLSGMPSVLPASDLHQARDHGPAASTASTASAGSAGSAASASQEA